MSSQTFISEILTVAKNHNPQASPEQILKGFIDILEKEVLPYAIRDVSMPSFPSWVKMATDMRGRKIKKKFLPKETLEEKRLVIQQVEYLRKLSWNGVDTETPGAYISDCDDLISPPQLGRSFEIEPILDKPRVKAPSLETAHRPYARVPFPSKRRNRFSISSVIQERIVSDTRLENVLKNIETGIRKLIETRNLEAYLEVYCKSDLEIPTWEKYIITVSPPLRMTFEEKMKIWEVFDLTIRNRISDLSKTADRKTEKYLNEINKKLFVHMEL